MHIQTLFYFLFFGCHSSISFKLRGEYILFAFYVFILVTRTSYPGHKGILKKNEG